MSDPQILPNPVELFGPHAEEPAPRAPSDYYREYFAGDDPLAEPVPEPEPEVPEAPAAPEPVVRPAVRPEPRTAKP